MKKNLEIKTGVIVAILLVFLWGIFLGRDPQESVKKMKEAAAQKGLGAAVLAGLQQNIHLGLDLKGGTHLILQVMVDEAVNSETERAVERLKEDLNSKNIPFTEISKPTDRVDQVLVKGVPPEQTTALRDFASESLAEYDISSNADNALVLTMKPSIVRDIKTRAVQQSMETIRSRIDTLGVSEPTIQEHGLGENQILVQLPGVDDPSRVKDIIQSTAMLQIKQAFGGPFATEQEAAQNAGSLVDKIILKGSSATKGGGGDAYYVVSRSSVVAGRDVRRAEVGRDEAGRPDVGFDLTGEAGRRFSQFTSSNIGNLLAVVLDNKVREVATIQSEIRDRGRISGNFTDQSASDLALILNSGALPASIRYLEDRTVGASLGLDSIKAGVTAALVGMALVLIFMLIYYHGAGINADLGLFLNLIILLGFMGFSGAVLTLPGIAGVILTIGMGVDSNVLIFERIREELRAGKMPAQAVDQGFARAWVTIIDTHITTIVSALILFLFGTGPVRGFAVTLAFGLGANLFTAVFVSRVIFDAILSKKQRGEALSI
ncbi:MAG: protein-export rane protein SecD [Acidobacteriaceae bacterium]|nr:protein-export rane protein SecD [Acidobacteriaceae bacterium]